MSNFTKKIKLTFLAYRAVIFAIVFSVLIAVPSTLYVVERQKNERQTAENQQKLEIQTENQFSSKDLVSSSVEPTTATTAPAPDQLNAPPKQQTQPIQQKTVIDCDFYDKTSRVSRDQSSADSAYNMYVTGTRLWNWDSGVYTPEEKTEKNLEQYQEYIEKVNVSYQAYQDAMISKNCPIIMEKPITKSPLSI